MALGVLTGRGWGLSGRLPTFLSLALGVEHGHVHFVMCNHTRRSRSVLVSQQRLYAPNSQKQYWRGCVMNGLSMLPLLLPRTALLVLFHHSPWCHHPHVTQLSS